MAQKGFDVLREKADSRYRLSLVVGRRAAELELCTVVVCGDGLPSGEEIGRQVQRDLKRAEEATGAYSVLREERKDHEEPGSGASKP